MHGMVATPDGANSCVVTLGRLNALLDMICMDDTGGADRAVGQVGAVPAEDPCQGGAGKHSQVTLLS